MEFKREDIELMAPVGSFESLQAAIQGGADAIYFGLGKLNMRSQSTINFTANDLAELTRIAKNAGIKTYLTINTVIYDKELAEMRQTVDLARQHNISAIIASDHAVVNYAREQGMEVHASTQLNISNTEALRHYSQWVDVAVLARELNLEQVRHISEQIKKENIKGPAGRPVGLEMFIHGALCMSISGKCYLSLHEKNKSANRGQCLQTCRKKYLVTENESGEELEIDHEYIMSPKDLCTLHFLNKIIDAGITVLKIEGRARSPEYVKTVTQVYNEALHAIIDGYFDQYHIDNWMEQLSMVFNRGFWDGYYLGQRLGEWSHIYGSKATMKKTYVGKITNYYTKLGVAEVKMESGELKTGDQILITGPTTGVIETKIEEIRVDLKTTPSTHKGELCSIPVKQFLRRSDKIYRWTEREQVKIN